MGEINIQGKLRLITKELGKAVLSSLPQNPRVVFNLLGRWSYSKLSPSTSPSAWLVDERVVIRVHPPRISQGLSKVERDAFSPVKWVLQPHFEKVLKI